MVEPLAAAVDYCRDQYALVKDDKDCDIQDRMAIAREIVTWPMNSSVYDIQRSLARSRPFGQK